MTCNCIVVARYLITQSQHAVAAERTSVCTTTEQECGWLRCESLKHNNCIVLYVKLTMQSHHYRQSWCLPGTPSERVALACGWANAGHRPLRCSRLAQNWADVLCLLGGLILFIDYLLCHNGHYRKRESLAH